MCDNFVEVILNSIEATDTSNVWMKTDDVTTTIRGKAVHVFDVSRAIFMHAAKTGEHIAFNATYSIGCPGDSEGNTMTTKDNVPDNSEQWFKPYGHDCFNFSEQPFTSKW